METIVQDMRKDIDVKVVKGDAFRVAYVGARCPDGDAGDRLVWPRCSSKRTCGTARQLAEGTNHFLEVQLGDARERLVEHEKKLEDTAIVLPESCRRSLRRTCR